MSLLGEVLISFELPWYSENEASSSIIFNSEIPLLKHSQEQYESYKPDFHSRFSLVASEIFRMGDVQNGETNRIGRKNIFSSVRI